VRILDLPIPYSVAKHTYLITNSRCRSPVWGTLPLRIEKKRAGGQLAFGLMRELVRFHVLSSHRCRKTFRVQLSFWRMIDPSSPQLPSVCGDLDPRGRQGASPDSPPGVAVVGAERTNAPENQQIPPAHLPVQRPAGAEPGDPRLEIGDAVCSLQATSRQPP
jgi:hypothetical protein